MRAISFNVYPSTSIPSTMTVPPVGLSILLMQWINVDFPTPLGPRIEMTCGSAMSRVIPSNTGFPEP